MNKFKLILGASILLLVSVQAQAMPISYQFHGEITLAGCPTTIALCESINEGDNYIGLLIYDVDTILAIDPPFHSLGGFPFYTLFFDNFAFYGDNTTDGTDAIGHDGDSLGMLDEVPRSIGPLAADELVRFSLDYSGPGVLDDFPDNLDAFNTGILSIPSIAFDDNPGGITGVIIATIEGFKRVGAAVPAPSVIWLFGIGLIGLVGFSKRRKAA